MSIDSARERNTSESRAACRQKCRCLSHLPLIPKPGKLAATAPPKTSRYGLEKNAIPIRDVGFDAAGTSPLVDKLQYRRSTPIGPVDRTLDRSSRPRRGG
jgi:hypothetical protein